jgi:hypothetical protein
MGDLGIYHEATGNWAVQTSSTGYVLTIWRAGFGGPGHQPIPADFDGDGLTDIAVYQTETGLWTILRSDTGNTLAFAVPYGGAGYTPVAGDWDGDRRADIGTYYVDGSWSIPLTGAGYRESLSRMLGGAGRVPLPPFR